MHKVSQSLFLRRTAFRLFSNDPHSQTFRDFQLQSTSMRHRQSDKLQFICGRDTIVP